MTLQPRSGYQSFAEAFWSMVPVGDLESRSRAVARAIAHVARTWADERGAGLVLDEPAYAAPEALRGEPADQRAVIFTLGVLLFERITNEHPFGPNLRTRIDRMRRGELAGAVELFTKVSAGLRPILTRALAPYPEDRFATLNDFATALEVYTQGPATDASVRRVAPGVEPDRTEIMQDAPERARMLHEWTLERERIRREIARRERRKRVAWIAVSLVIAAGGITVLALALVRHAA